MAQSSYKGEQDPKIKRLLRNRVTGEYFKNDGWTKDPFQATCFCNVVEVAQVCAKCGLKDVELTLHDSNSGAELFCTPMR